jgi:signal transduction histidine kinase
MQIFYTKPIGPPIAPFRGMISSLENIYQKMTPASDTAEAHREPVPREQIGGDVAHELNNILTIVRGYADRLIHKHGENPALRPELQLIADNARRAENVVRQASLASRRAAGAQNSLALR